MPIRNPTSLLRSSLRPATSPTLAFWTPIGRHPSAIATAAAVAHTTDIEPPPPPTVSVSVSQPQDEPAPATARDLDALHMDGPAELMLHPDPSVVPHVTAIATVNNTARDVLSGLDKCPYSYTQGTVQTKASTSVKRHVTPPHCRSARPLL